jgi:hypothetical protein
MNLVRTHQNDDSLLYSVMSAFNMSLLVPILFKKPELEYCHFRSSILVAQLLQYSCFSAVAAVSVVT